MTVYSNNGGCGLLNVQHASDKRRGLSLYMTNNLANVAGTGSFSGSSMYNVVAGHMSAVAAASALTQTESFRAHDAFADVVRGLMVWGRKVLRETALAKSVILID